MHLLHNMQKLTQIVYVPTKSIVRDENQPRQYFDPHKLGRLADSIKKLGVKEPLTVEGLPDGTYKIVDGERRWRAAQSIGLKELPVIIEKTLTPADRVIEQFHIQELREGWQPDEKAIAINSLAEVLDISFVEAARLVGMPDKTARSYQALMRLQDRETFISNKISVERAENVFGIIVTAQHQTRKQTDKDLTDKETKTLEKVLVNKLITGEMRTASDFRTLRDAITKDASNVQKFIAGKSPSELFNSSKAGAHRTLRHLNSGVVNLSATVKAVIRSKEARDLLDEETNSLKARIKALIRDLNTLV